MGHRSIRVLARSGLESGTMSRSLPVALLGFSAFERAALSAFLRLPRGRAPRYEAVEALAAGEVAIADADQPAVVEALQHAGRVHDTVFVGSHAPAGASAWTMRPIDPLRVLRELDSMVMLQAPQRMPTHAPTLAPTAARVERLATDEPAPDRRLLCC